MPTLHIVARVVARRGEEARVRKEFEALVAPTRAEPGCLRYELFVDRDNPGDFLFVQEYQDQSAFEAHLASKHITAMLKVVLPLLARQAPRYPPLSPTERALSAGAGFRPPASRASNRTPQPPD